MTREDIVELFDQRQRAMRNRDAAALARLHADDGVLESPMAGTVTGRSAIEQVYETWIKGFPDLLITVEQLLIDGDQVAQIATLSGTDIGGFMGLPATGKPFRIPLVFLGTVKDHRITQARTLYDFTGLLVQVGILKAKPA